MNKYLFSLGIAISLFSLPLISHAEEAVYTITVFPENMEKGLELINLVLALAAAFFAIKLAALSQGGQFEKTWNMLAGAVSIFALVEVVGVLKEFKFVHFAGSSDLLEFAFIVTMLFTVYTTRKKLLKTVFGK